MSQKELLEEGFSDKIRGIAKAIKTGVKQAARQGTRLDTGQLVGDMGKSYKDEQPITVLKRYLEDNPKIEIVKIDKGNIKKQQASGKKGYLGRIVGPKSITLIPFEGTLLGTAETQRQFKGPGAGVMEAFASEDAELTDVPRDEKGQIKGVHKDGGVKKQMIKLLLKNGVEESWAAKFSEFARHIRSKILPLIQKTHPQIKFTFNPKPELGGFDVEKAEADIAEVKPDDYRAKTESLSLRDITQLSGEVLIVEASRRQIEMRKRAKDAGVVASRYKTLDELQKAVEAAEKANSAEERFKERNPEKADPVAEEPVVEPEKDKPEEQVYPGHEKFLASLDDKVVLDLLKLKQNIQPGLQIKFEGEQKEDEKGVDISGVRGETGMFVAEIFRTKKGLQVGDIYRAGNPKDVIIKGVEAAEKEEKADPVDTAVNELKADNKQLSINELVTKMQELIKVKKISPDVIDSTKLDPAAIAQIARPKDKDPAAKLLPRDIELVKQALVKLRVVREGTSQKNLLRQLTLLSR